MSLDEIYKTHDPVQGLPRKDQYLIEAIASNGLTDRMQVDDIESAKREMSYAFGAGARVVMVIFQPQSVKQRHNDSSKHRP